MCREILLAWTAVLALVALPARHAAAQTSRTHISRAAQLQTCEENSRLVQCAAPPLVTSEMVRQTLPSVVVISVRKRDMDKPVVGTGFVTAAIAGGGYVATCRHVVAGAEGISVTFPGGKPFAGELDFEDAAHDVAVLRIVTDRKLRPLLLAAADPEPGADIVAIGHPFGYLHTVTKGIVGGLGREVELSATTLRDVIQHSAPINVGNSGGPLLNDAGDVAGMNVAYREGNGISFAISAKTMRARLPGRGVQPTAAPPSRVVPARTSPVRPMSRADD